MNAKVKWTELANELLSAVPVDIHDDNAWVREACQVMRDAIREREQNAGEAVYLIRVGENRAWTECGFADYLAAKDRTYRVNGRLTPAESRIVYTHPAQAVSVPDGWKLVPVKPTPEMLKRGFGAFMAAHDAMFCKNEPCEPIWRCMVESTPTAPAGEGEDHA